MFTIECSVTVALDLRNANKKSPSISSRLKDICVNPFTKAIETNLPAIGNYYVNAGRYCILFNVDTEKEIIDIKYVVSSPLLHKIITGRLQPQYLEVQSS